MRLAYLSAAAVATVGCEGCSGCWVLVCRLTVAHCVSLLLLLPCRYESAELYWRLFDCGVPVKHLVYNKVRPGPDGGCGGGGAGNTGHRLAHPCRHLCRSLLGLLSAANCSQSQLWQSGLTFAHYRIDCVASALLPHCLCLQVGHGEFVTDWPSNFTQSPPDADSPSSSTSTTSTPSLQQQAAWLQELPPYCRDLAVVVSGHTPVSFVHKSRLQGSSSLPDAVQSAQRGLDEGSATVAGVGSRAQVGVPSEWN